MGTLLDAYPLIALLVGDPVADEVEAIIRGGDASVTSVNLAEMLEVAQRRFGRSERECRRAVSGLTEGGLRILPVGEPHAWRAAELRARHYAPRQSELSLADCFLLAAAGPNDAIATPDPPVVGAARAERIAVIALPDSSGRRP